MGTEPENSLDGAVDPSAVCDLPADGLEARLAWVQQEILPYRVGHERLHDGIALEVSAAPGVADKLDRLVALERDCCSSLRFEHLAGATPDRRRLEIHGVDPDAATFRRLRGDPEPRPGGGDFTGPGRRVAKAAGIGVAASALLCCLAPMGAAALLGAAAAPLAGLDAPAPIAAGALLAGGVAGWWLGRRQEPGDAGGPGC